MDNTIDQCKNCKYFIPHYAKNKAGKIMSVNCGHCVCRKLRFSMPFERKTHCSFWAPMREQIEERRERIKSRLMRMAEYIEQIAEVFADDETYTE